MNKVLVEVFCPVTNKSYDIYVPTNLVVYEVKILISKLIEDISNTKYFKLGQVVLCDYQTGQIISDQMSFDDLKIKNGFKLLLI